MHSRGWWLLAAVALAGCPGGSNPPLPNDAGPIADAGIFLPDGGARWHVSAYGARGPKLAETQAGIFVSAPYLVNNGACGGRPAVLLARVPASFDDAGVVFRDVVGPGPITAQALSAMTTGIAVGGAMTAASDGGVTGAWVTSLDDTLTERWTVVLSSSVGDSVQALAALPSGELFVAGTAVDAGASDAGSDAADIFLARLRADGARAWQRRVGTPERDSVLAAAAWGSQLAVVMGTTGPWLADGGAPAATLALFEGDGTPAGTAALGFPSDFVVSLAVVGGELAIAARPLVADAERYPVYVQSVPAPGQPPGAAVKVGIPCAPWSANAVTPLGAGQLLVGCGTRSSPGPVVHLDAQGGVLDARGLEPDTAAPIQGPNIDVESLQRSPTGGVLVLGISIPHDACAGMFKRVSLTRL